MTLIIPNAGSPRYIAKFSAITDSPSPRTSLSVSALSMIDKVDNIGVIAAFTASLNNGCSLSKSAMYGENESVSYTL